MSDLENVWDETTYHSVGQSPKPTQAFLGALKALDSQLYPSWHPRAGKAKQGRWVLRRRLSTCGSISMGDPIVLVLEDYQEAQPCPFDNRVIERLRNADSWAKYGSAVKMIRSVEDRELKSKSKKIGDPSASFEVASRIYSDFYRFKTVPLNLNSKRSTFSKKYKI